MLSGRYERGVGAAAPLRRFWKSMDEINDLRNRADASGNMLGETDERFHLFIESVRDYAIYMLDPTGRIVSWNTGAQNIKGYSQEEVIGRHFSLFFTAEDIE